MPTSHDVRPTTGDVAQLLQAAAKADTLRESARLTAEAQRAQDLIYAAARQDCEVDMANAAIGDRFVPVVPLSHAVTAASDWLGELDTSADAAQLPNHIMAEAALWFGAISPEVKADAGEFIEQARGRAVHVTGSLGEHAATARQMFLDQVAELRQRDVHTGAIKEAGSSLPQVGEQSYPGDTFGLGNYDGALPGEATTSQRAPQLRELEQNTGPDASRDVVPVNDPALGQSDPSADLANGDAGTQRDGSNMTNPQRTASRQHVAYSGLDQIQQTEDPSDTQYRPTPLNQEVAFPITWDNGGSGIEQTIQQAEQQIAERDTRRGASLARAQAAARQAFVASMKAAGYDASGWIGDMGAGGYQPGMPPQGAPGHNLGEPDPVYGYGGDQGDRPGNPVGAAERNDDTNDPSGLGPGDDYHGDVGGRGMVTGSRYDSDPEIRKAQEFIARRRQFLAQQAR